MLPNGRYDKNIALEVTETAPLGDWICHMLKESELVLSSGKGSNNVLTELQLNEFQNVKHLRLYKCDLVTHLLKTTYEVIKFPSLSYLDLASLECLTYFYSATIEGIEFPRLQNMYLGGLPEFQNFWPTPNNSITHSNPLFHEKVSCPNLEDISRWGPTNISALCSRQLPTTYFNKLHILVVSDCGELRNLISLSVARGLLNLGLLAISNCQSMEEVIIKEEQQGEGIMTLFPWLQKLSLPNLPKLGHFFLTNHALEFPFLRSVDIYDCPKMKTFIQHEISVSTPSLESVNFPFNYEVKVDDLDKWTQQRFNYKEQNASDAT